MFDQFSLTTDWLKARSAASPHALGLILETMSWTYAEIDSLVDDVCRFLQSGPRPKNGRLGVLLPNRLPYVCLVHAAARLNLTLVTFNTRLTPAELAWQIELTHCQTIIWDDLFSEKVATLRHSTKTETIHFIQWHAAVFQKQKGNRPAPVWSPETSPSFESIHSIVFTSGTTGRPKAVPITYAQHFFSALGSAYRLGVESDDLWLSCLPLYHVGGMAILFRSTLYGTGVDLHPRFDLEKINVALDEKSITLISVVPTMLFRLLQQRQKWPKSMRIILVGGAAASRELVEAANRLADRPLVSTSFGMTETASQFATLTPAETARKPGGVGKPFLFNQLKIMRDDNQPAAPKEIGEIWVSGPSVMQGYINNPSANEERFVGRWFRTGDLGYLDEAGDAWVVQRRSDLIISGGENIYPTEVEAILRTHPAVAEVAVVGLPDSEWGQVVGAMIQLKPHARLEPADLQLFARKHLAGYKLPRKIVTVKALPQTASGKIERKRVEEMMMGKDEN